PIFERAELLRDREHLLLGADVVAGGELHLRHVHRRQLVDEQRDRRVRVRVAPPARQGAAEAPAAAPAAAAARAPPASPAAPAAAAPAAAARTPAAAAAA